MLKLLVRNTVLSALLLLLVLLVLSSCTAAQDTPNVSTPISVTLEGTTVVSENPVISGVVLSGTLPVEGARIELHKSTDSGSPEDGIYTQTLSDAAGKYELGAPLEGGAVFLLAFWPDGSVNSAPPASVQIEPGAIHIEADVVLAKVQEVTMTPVGGLGAVPADMAYIFQIPDDPVSVTPTLDREHQVEDVLPVSGGTLRATGVDGALYQLDIPANALVVDTVIRMIPLSALDGMPFGTDALAVQLEPEGLQLYEIATLTITPTLDMPIDQQIFFGYEGEGENLILANPVVDSREIRIQLTHFSGYGVTKGLLADTTAVKARIGGDAETRIQNALAAELQRVRQEQLLGNENGASIDWESWFTQYEEQVVKPRLAAAGESCAAGRAAIQTLLGFERQKQLLGMGSDSGSSLADGGVLDTVAEVCMKEEYELCRDDHIIHRIIPAWLGMERQFQLLGYTGEGGVTASAIESARNYVRRCLTFELQFESQFSFHDGPDGYDSSVTSKIKIQFDPANLTWKGSAPLVNTAFEYKLDDCSVSSVRGGGTFEAMSLAYISDTKSPTDELGYVRDFKLVYFPGDTTESFTVKCPDVRSLYQPSEPFVDRRLYHPA